MKTEIASQAVRIVLCFLMGLASGVLYDAFRALRRESSLRALTSVLDAFFCAAVCFSLFVIGMSAGEGSIDIAMLAFAALGFGAYMELFSNAVLSLFRRLLGLIKKPFVKVFSALSEMTKTVLAKAVYWYRNKRGGEKHEKAESSAPCSHCDYGDADLWRGNAICDGTQARQNGKRKQHAQSGDKGG